MNTTITIKQFCEALQIKKTAFYDWQKKGKTPRTFTVNGQVRILRTEFERWLAERVEAA